MVEREGTLVVRRVPARRRSEPRTAEQSTIPAPRRDDLWSATIRGEPIPQTRLHDVVLTDGVAPLADHGTPERAQHGELVTRETMVAGITGKRVKHECRLDWYWEKGSIVDRQYEAGLRFRRDWHFAAEAPSVVGAYGPRISRVAGRQDFTDTQLGARRRTAAAIALLGRDL